jgi:ribosomal protein L37E
MRANFARTMRPAMGDRATGPAGATMTRAAVTRTAAAFGNQAKQRMLLAGIQAKLAVSEPGDALEREADAKADEVLRMSDSVPAGGESGTGEHIQRKCAACGETTTHLPQSKCAACEAEERRIDRKGDAAAQAQGEPAPAPGAGTPLPAAVRSFFEPRFGHDLGRVRVHTDARSAASAQSLNALAYTRGHDIVFDSGQYAPATRSGMQLLAHELAHVVQQSAGARTVQRLVRRSLLNGCGTGQNPFAADRRASLLLTNAIARIDSARAERPADAAHADVVAIGNAMRAAFRLNPANDDHWNLPAPNFGLPLIRRRLEIARDYIDSVVFTYNCCTVGGACPATCGTCAATEEAFICRGEASTITLCPLFWTRNPDQRGRVLAHEVLHITFGFIRDWDQPDRANAHCYAQFTALANDFNSPAGWRCH